MAEVLFSLNRAADEAASMVYRPWGTRTLKVQVRTETAAPALRLRPRGVRVEEAQRGLFRAYADDSEAFIVSWGGGHEAGPCLRSRDFLMAFERCAPLEAGGSSLIYFNVSHQGPETPDEAMVTLDAYDEVSGRVFASLPVHLQKAAGFPQTAVRFERVGTEQWRPVGDAMPRYDPRWWPRPVSYVPAGDLPLLVQRRQTDLLVQWQGKTVATVSDHTKPTILDESEPALELFDFDRWHVALRIWFFWLDTNVGHGFFVGRHEVPDAERFDLLIRRRDGQVTLACTDLHWREVWGQVATGPLRATLGLTRETKIRLAEEKLGKLWPVWRREKQVDHDRIYNPLGYIERLAAVRGEEAVGEVRAKGTEAHLPMLHNVMQSEEVPPRMTSSDVRLG